MGSGAGMSWRFIAGTPHMIWVWVAEKRKLDAQREPSYNRGRLLLLPMMVHWHGTFWTIIIAAHLAVNSPYRPSPGDWNDSGGEFCRYLYLNCKPLCKRSKYHVIFY